MEIYEELSEPESGEYMFEADGEQFEAQITDEKIYVAKFGELTDQNLEEASREEYDNLKEALGQLSQLYESKSNLLEARNNYLESVRERMGRVKKGESVQTQGEFSNDELEALI